MKTFGFAKDRADQDRYDDVLRHALMPTFNSQSQQANYWRACLLRCFADRLNLTKRDVDWKVYRDLIYHSERMGRDVPAINKTIDDVCRMEASH